MDTVNPLALGCHQAPMPKSCMIPLRQPFARTSAAFTRRIGVSRGREKSVDLCRRQLRILVVHEMIALFRDSDSEVVQGLGQRVGPFRLVDGIVTSPKDPSRGLDFGRLG